MYMYNHHLDIKQIPRYFEFHVTCQMLTIKEVDLQLPTAPVQCDLHVAKGCWKGGL